MDWLLSQLERQMQHVASAPIPFIVSLCAATLIVIWLLSQHYEARYQDRIDNLQSAKNLLENRVAYLESRLSIANGQKNGSASELPTKEKPSGSRGLTQEQMTIIRRNINVDYDTKRYVPISIEVGCDDCISLQNELEFALSNLKNLEIKAAGVVMGPNETHPTGLLIIAPDFDDPKSFASQLSAALTKAGIEHGTKARKLEMPELAARIDVLKPRKY